ncbi:MAG: hypothetical protein KFF68_11955 [Desulfosarcina sp.]|nr:hypothetical protein [Desulfosarcina sp.]
MDYRVIQWATGSMGKTCLRAVIDHPDLELVGLYVYNEKKAGRDAGDIAVRNKTGVLATRSMSEILALDADAVIHTPRIQFPYASHNEDICRLLASGKNLVSINGHCYPAAHGQAYAAPFEKACQQGGASLFGTGLNPGFVAEKIAAAATGACLDIDHIDIKENFDVTGVPEHDYVFNVLGFGSDPASFGLSDTGPVAELMDGMYREVVALMAKRLFLDLEGVVSDHRVEPAAEPITARAGIIPAGTVAATHWCWHGMVAGKRLITLRVSWVMGTRPTDGKAADHWKIMIRGRPGIDIAMNLVEPHNTGVKTKSEQYAVAASVINSIPEVCAAPPGIYEPPLFAPFRKRF